MESILAFLDRIEDVLEESRGVPFSNKVSVDKESIYEIIDEIRINLPNEIRQAQRIVTDCDKIMSDGKAKSQAMIRDAEDQVDMLVSEHEISKRAYEHARLIVEDGRRETMEMNLNAREYVDEMLEKAEATINTVISEIKKQSHALDDNLSSMAETIYRNRQELRSVQKKDERH